MYAGKDVARRYILDGYIHIRLYNTWTIRMVTLHKKVAFFLNIYPIWMIARGVADWRVYHRYFGACTH